jgi:hypothetical protein
MIPLTVDPTVVILTDEQGNPRRIATNVAQDVQVITTQTPDEFDELSKGRPFVRTVNPIDDEPNILLTPVNIDEAEAARGL